MPAASAAQTAASLGRRTPETGGTASRNVRREEPVTAVDEGEADDAEVGDAEGDGVTLTPPRACDGAPGR
ncbi:hypothetical protein Pka01_58810 [Planotetraspora kaengkrachanensis]|uniref:Uncharacterized protein n=1 Tax=Planotetraspora kaengkrachanensis TaxID=575193 RepID=A0A8J3VAE5_9ACTN|nr:hypothetical protein Pka01_58810 [Planotetraspora kaengkrachanensis]